MPVIWAKNWMRDGAESDGAGRCGRVSGGARTRVKLMALLRNRDFCLGSISDTKYNIDEHMCSH